MHPASRPFPSIFLRYEHCREPYARARPPHGVQLGTRHPTTRTNIPSAKKRLRNFQGLQREQEGCVFRSQQVLPQRALALQEIKYGLHHVGRYPDLKAREMEPTAPRASAVAFVFLSLLWRDGLRGLGRHAWLFAPSLPRDRRVMRSSRRGNACRHSRGHPHPPCEAIRRPEDTLRACTSSATPPKIGS